MNDKNRPHDEPGSLPTPADGRPAAALPIFTVAVAGLATRELRLIDIALRHQKEVIRRFERVDVRPLFADGPYPDIVVANPFAIDGVKALARARTVNDQLPTVHAIPLGSPARARYSIVLERIGLQLLSRLNEVVETAFESARPGASKATVPPFPLSLQLPDSLDLPDLSVTAGSASVLPADQPSMADGLWPGFLAPAVTPAMLAPVPAQQASAKPGSNDPHEMPPSGAGAGACDASATGSGKATASLGIGAADTKAGLDDIVSPAPLTAPPSAVPATSEMAELAPEPAEAASPVVQTTAQPLPAAPRQRRLTQALIVGATPSVADAVESAFAQLGSTSLHCARADNRRQVIEHLDYQACQLVMIEKVLAEGSGFRLARELHRRFPEVVVVMLADRFSLLDGLRGRLAGCASLLARPIEPARLRAAVRSPLRRAREQQTMWAVAQAGDSSVWGQTAWLDTGIGR